MTARLSLKEKLAIDDSVRELLAVREGESVLDAARRIFFYGSPDRRQWEAACEIMKANGSAGWSTMQRVANIAATPRQRPQNLPPLPPWKPRNGR